MFPLDVKLQGPITRLAPAAAILIATLIAPGAFAVDFDSLGDFEKETVGPVLKELGLSIDASPEGKTIRNIRVVNRDVFSEDDGAFLRWFNIFHRTTQSDIIERELLIEPGMTFNEALIDESLRNVRDPFLSNVVVILPIETGDPTTVDLLVVTRDVWSLRLNSNFQFQGEQLSLLSLSLAENNFMGWRKQLAFVFNMDQGAIQLGPTWKDPNIAGTRLTLDSSAAVIFSREAFKYEGTRSSTTLTYPLWALSSTWGGALFVSHYDSVIRSFFGSGLREFDAIDGAGLEQAVPWKYRYTYLEVEASATHQFGDVLKQNLTFGYEFALSEAEPTQDFAFDATVRDQFESGVLPRRERASAVFIKYRAFTPEYLTLRDFRTYDLREDYQLGPDFSYTLSQAVDFLGGNVNYTWLRGEFSFAFNPGKYSYIKLLGSWSGRLEDGELVDQSIVASFTGTTPKIGGALRAVFRAQLHSRFNDRSNSFYGLGGDTGLRGYPIGFFTGLRRLRTNLELRSTPLALWFFRFGAVAFWDMGHAADEFEDLQMRHDVGLGIRILIPQINPYVLRLDWAFPVSEGSAAWPGRVSFGFLQAF
jgi:hypothetical protein